MRIDSLAYPPRPDVVDRALIGSNHLGLSNMTQLRLGVENSTWNNIGDGFYQLALCDILTRAYPNYEVCTIDGPPARAFRARRHVRKIYDSRTALDVDVAIFSGPILNKTFITDYMPLIQRLKRDGRQYMILSAHSDRDSQTVEKVKSAMAEYPPLALSTRDRRTYEYFDDIAAITYDGVCAAFFVSKLESIAPVRPHLRYIIVSHHTMPEPLFCFSADASGAIDVDSVLVKKGSSRGWRIIRHFEFLRDRQKTINGFDIVRLHQGLYRFNHILFAAPNSYVSYNPLCYLSLYKGASLVISDRVHACVAGLSYGKAVYFFGDTPRSDLFRRPGLVRTRSGLMQANPDALDSEYHSFMSWLRTLPLK